MKPLPKMKNIIKWKFNLILVVLLLNFVLKIFGQEGEIATNQTVKIGTLNIEVLNYNKSIFQIDSIVTSLKGFIAQEQEANFKTKISNEIIIRIPTVQFSNLVYGINKIANKVNTKDIKVVKVEKEIADLSKRLQSKEEVKARYMELIEKSKLAIEIADLENKINSLNGEIEKLQKEIGNFTESSHSTLYISMMQQAEIKGNLPSNATDMSKNAMLEFFRNILLYSLVPVLLILGYYFLIYKRIQRAKRHKRRSQSGEKSLW